MSINFVYVHVIKACVGTGLNIQLFLMLALAAGGSGLLSGHR